MKKSVQLLSLETWENLGFVSFVEVSCQQELGSLAEQFCGHLAVMRSNTIKSKGIFKSVETFKIGGNFGETTSGSR